MGRFSVFNVVDTPDYVFDFIHFRREETIFEIIKSNFIKPRLFIFPHAGGSNFSYQKLEAELLPFFVTKTLCYPGRGSRFSEKLQDSLEILVADMIDLLRKENLQLSNFFFLGHSFGSLVLFETMREMRRLGFPLPEAIFLSGRKAPSIPYTGNYWSRESDRSFTELLISKGGIPQEVYENKEFLEFFLPIIRSDFKLLEGYQYVIQDPFDIPFYIINGIEDQSISDDDTWNWQQETSIGCQFIKMRGNHFYLLDNTADFVKKIVEVSNFSQ